MSLNSSFLSKFNDICRTCLKGGQILTYLYDEQNNINLVTKLKTCTAIEFDKSDQMPNKICPACIEELLQAYNFINKCQISDSTLRKYFADESVIKIEDPPLESPENQPDEMKSELIDDADATNAESEPEYFDETSDITIKDEFLEMVQDDLKTIGNPKKRKRADSAPDHLELTESLSHKKPATDDNNLLVRADHLNKTFSADSTGETSDDDGAKYVRKTRSAIGKENFTKLDLHIFRTRKGPGRKKFSCPVCSQMIVNAVSLFRHFRNHTDTKNLTKGGRKSSKSLTSKIKQTECEICRKKFEKPDDLITHFEQHINANKCKYCDKLYLGAKMIKHVRTCHAGSQPYQCSKCARRFRDADSMQSHKTQFHCPNKLLKCAMCSYTFDTDAQLVAHEGDHVGAAPYNCQTCDSVFDEARLLMKHKMAGKCGKFYNCPECLRVFQSLKNKNVHKLKEH